MVKKRHYPVEVHHIDESILLKLGLYLPQIKKRLKKDMEEDLDGNGNWKDQYFYPYPTVQRDRTVEAPPRKWKVPPDTDIGRGLFSHRRKNTKNTGE